MLSNIHDLFDNHAYKPLVIGRRRRYDETPYRRLRIKEDDATEGQRAHPAIVKTLQTQFACFALLHNPATDSYHQLQGDIPMMLQMMDSGSAEVLVQCQKEVQSVVSDFDAVASRFPLNTAHVCTDRYSANLLAERILQHESSVRYLLQHSHCAVHKLASTEGKVLELVSYHLSGMVSCGACMRVGGARATLRKHLFNIIAERLEIRLGMPQAEAHRHHVYQWFLGKGMPGFATATPNNELSMRAARQRCILSHVMNGDIS